MTAPRPISEAEINAFVDGELTAEERAEMEALLAAAPAEAGLVRDFRDLNEAMQARYAGRLEAPLPPAMLAQLGRLPRWPAALASRQLAFAAALLIALAAGMVGYFLRGYVSEAGRTEQAFVLNAIGAHSVYLPEVRHPVEVKAEEEHLVRWLTRRVGAPVRAPSLAERGWKLMGGRLLPDLGLPAAQFMYEDGAGRRITLYIRKEAGLNNTAFRFYERDGFGAFYWIDRPLAYAIAGRLSRAELTALANAVYAQLEQR
jgi:anti-sigma factor RsiW